MQTPCSESHRTYPLCLPRSKVDVDDLHRYHEELNSRAPNLFTKDAGTNEVAFRQYTPGRSTCPSDSCSDLVVQVNPKNSRQYNPRSCVEGQWSRPITLSTLENISSVLRVSIFESSKHSLMLTFTLECADHRDHKNVVSTT